MGLTWRSYIMLQTLITSKTRIKLLLKFFLNSNTTSYLKNLEAEFEDSSNGIRVELNKFEVAGLLISENVGNKKIFKANTKHPMFSDIHNIVLKYAGLDQVIDKVVGKLGNVQRVYLVGSFANGVESKIIDIVLMGNINREFLLNLIDKAETLIGRKIRFVIYTQDEFDKLGKEILAEKHLLIWTSEI